MAAFTLFMGSFLLFGIQPMLGRTLLPSFGGSAAVWTVCLAAYQLLLLAGYGYAHLLSRRSARTQRRAHVVLLSLAVLWTFAFAALRLWLKSRTGDSGFPALEVLACVALFAGLPYVLLSANSSLIQAWLARADGARGAARGVYKLYAVSNLGSLLGLLAYPFLLEPFVSLNAQWYGFAVGLLVYTALLAVVASRTLRHAPALALPDAQCVDSGAGCQHVSGLPAPLTRPWLWFALPCLSTFLLNAVTAHLSTDVTPVPLMWVLLLTAYLLSFILGFSFVGEKGLVVWTAFAVAALAGAAAVIGLKGGQAFLPNLMTGTLLVLMCSTAVHGWLYRIRPDAAQLTRFYLGLAAGGAAGGAAASLLAPMLFDRVWEYPLALLAACAACAWLLSVWKHPELKGLSAFLMATAGVAAFLTVNATVKVSGPTIARTRNFYGCLRVDKLTSESSYGNSQTLFELYHGETLHGAQFREHFQRHTPTIYYGPKGGGLAISSHTNSATGSPLRVGLIGLGAGTMAAYGRTNDLYRFYEINPSVVTYATDTNCFTFLSDSPAKVELAVGDARKRLEQERISRAPLYDVLLVDAYSGDSVPFHLATHEAFGLYLDRLQPNGILAVHISNWHIDLTPLCKAVTEAFGLHAVGVLSGREGLSTEASWVLLSRQPLTVDTAGTREVNWSNVRRLPLPTDERGSLLSLIRFRHTPPVKALDIRLGL